VSFHRADENANVAMRNALDRFTDLQKKFHINILIIHHNGKGESNSRSAGRGASSIFDWCRNSIELKYSGKNSNTLELVHHKANNLPLFGSVKIIRDENLNYVLAEDLNAKSTINPNFSKKADLIDKAMSELGGKVDSQSLLIAKMIELSNAKDVKMSNGTAHKLITEAISSGKLKTENSSGNKKVITQP